LRYVGEEIPLQDELSLFVLLVLLVRSIVFPAQDLGALYALNVSYCMQAGGHRPIRRLTAFDVNHLVEEIRSSVLAVKLPRHHTIYGGQVSTTSSATEHPGSSEIFAMLEPHESGSGWGADRELEL